MRGLLSHLLLAGLLGAGSASAATRYVSKAGAHVSPYTTWANAATSLTAIAGVLGNNDVVMISNGVHAVTGLFTVARSGVTFQSVNGPEVTVLDGLERTTCLYINQSNFRLLGLTIRNGSNSANGGGVAIGANRTGLVVSNCVFESNVAAADGGGLYFPATAAGVVTDCRFLRNRGTYGGGLCGRGGALVVSNCYFAENLVEGGPGTGGAGIFLASSGLVVSCVFAHNVSSGNDGGGILVSGGTPIIDRCRFEDNTADDWGGGLASYGGTLIIQNSWFAGNRADEGGAIYFDAGGVIRNCTVVDNRANLLSSSGGGLSLRGGAVENSVVYFNEPDNYAVAAALRMTNCCSTPLPAGTLNFTNDPQLLWRAERVLWPATNSPLREAGVSRSWMTGAADYAGQARSLGTGPDIGAYEVGQLVSHFAADPSRGPPPLAVAFTAVVTGTNTTGVGRRWDFTNDGAYDTAGLAVAGASNTYGAAGSFTVRLNVTNAGGQTAECIRTNYVTAAPIRYVAPGGLHLSPFTNWVTAATNVEAAVDEAGERGLVLVSNGTYVLAGELMLTNELWLSGVNGPGVTALVAPAASRLARLEPGALLAGLRLTGGTAPATGDYAQCGGALLLRYGGTASNLVIASSTAATAGGGVCLAGGGLVTHSTIQSNQAGLGGGVAVFSGGDVVNCRIETNVAAGTGGGVYLSGNSVIRNVLLLDNRAGTNGGGAAIVRSGGTLENCTVLRNIAAGNGGGVYTENAGNVQNSILVSNVAVVGANWHTNAGSGGYGFFYTYLCTAPTSGLPNAVGCISNAPDFRAAATNDFRLLPGSAGMDAGATLAWMSAATDLGGGPRLISGTVDLGAYEAPGLLLEITNLTSGLRVPFRTTQVSVSGRGYNLSGGMGYTNATAGQLAVSNFPAAASWSATAWLPARGSYVLTVFATNSSGVATQATVTLERSRSQLFWVEP